MGSNTIFPLRQELPQGRFEDFTSRREQNRFAGPTHLWRLCLSEVIGRLQEALFVSQRDDGIDTHGAARRQVASGERNKGQQNRYTHKCQRISRTHAEEQT